MDGVVEWYMTAFRKYAQFDGRSRRRECWTFLLVNFAINIFGRILLVLVAGGVLGTLVAAIFGLFGLATLIPTIAVGVRRLHDTGRAGWFALLLLVPIVGWLVLLVLYAQEGEAGDNQYGPNPKVSLAYA